MKTYKIHVEIVDINSGLPFPVIHDRNVEIDQDQLDCSPLFYDSILKLADQCRADLVKGQEDYNG